MSEILYQSDALYDNSLGDSRVYAEAIVLDKISFLEKLDKAFAHIKGQDAPLQCVKEKLYDFISESNKSKKPKVLFLLGAPAVGKTETCNAITSALAIPSKTIYASGLTDIQVATLLLCGVQRSFKDAKCGIFTGFVDGHPFSIVIIEEIEKIHIGILLLFMQMLEEGFMYDNFFERDIDFRNVIIIFTSNAAKDIWDYSHRYVLSDTPTSKIIKSLKKEKNARDIQIFADAFISRISGNIIFFNNLRTHTIKNIAVEKIQAELNAVCDSDKIKITVNSDKLAELIILNSGDSADLRTINQSIKNTLNRIRARAAEVADSLSRDGNLFDTVNIEISMKDASVEARAFLEKSNSVRILVNKDFSPKSFHLNSKSDVEFIYAGSDFNKRTLSALDITMAILDANSEDTKEIFNSVREIDDIPIYVYCYDENAKSKLYYYMDHGADTASKDVGEWIENIINNADFTYIVDSLSRSGKIIDYEVSFKFDKRAHSVVATLHKIICKKAIDASEEGEFISEREMPNVSFSDIIGLEDVKKELQIDTKYLKNFRQYIREGVRIPRGILLQGPPGVGKTMIAKAFAAESDMVFIQKNAAEFIQKYVGDGPKMIREMFALARKYAPAVLFIDEIDAIAKSRLSDYGDNHHTNDQLNTLLSELDGFATTQTKAPVFVIAATNFDITRGETKLDEAFLRRLDRKIALQLPSFEDRKVYLASELSKIKNVSVSEDQIEELSKRSVSYSLADLNLVVQNALRRYEDNNGVIGMNYEELTESFESLFAGSKKSISKEALEKTAYHEAGHALAAILLGLPITHATVVSRSNYSGLVQFDNEEKTDFTKPELLNRIAVTLAGRASEIAFYGEKGITSGASSDLKSATDLCLSMVCDLGMGEDVFMAIDRSDSSSMKMARENAYRILEEQYKQAIEIINENKEIVVAVASELIAKNTLSGKAISGIVEKYK